MGADAALAREAAVALDEQATIEMEAQCEAVAAVSADAALAREAAAALGVLPVTSRQQQKWRQSVSP